MNSVGNKNSYISKITSNRLWFHFILFILQRENFFPFNSSIRSDIVKFGWWMVTLLYSLSIKYFCKSLQKTTHRFWDTFNIFKWTCIFSRFITFHCFRMISTKSREKREKPEPIYIWFNSNEILDSSSKSNQEFFHKMFCLVNFMQIAFWSIFSFGTNEWQ